MDKTDTKPETAENPELENVRLKCPHCGSVWVTSLLVEWCNCLNCEQKLKPSLHIITDSEYELN